ncbi:hypothetical protein [Microlunatus soli]|uniref:Uncharacterized protein n=1 Tax=Microlunatus soli TaxID=630515 RepID=A0A1H1W7J0_9ACTN|nr:hypothetical protein [Microlunatus soli]SDS93053.1 hypothetical protein SAMN04489812_3523 [Microlunatus soli]
MSGDDDARDVEHDEGADERSEDDDGDDGAPPRSVRDWLTWLRRTIFG